MKTPQLPIPELEKALGLSSEIWLKYENKHHYGSHKGRSIPFMIDEYRKTGIYSFVISSSGNAALAALRCIITHNKSKPANALSLKIFVGKNIEPYKLEKLQTELGDSKEISVEQVENPKQSALMFEKNLGAKWLRTSTDPLALLGYQSLADELGKIDNLSAVFVPTSSGTTAEGLYLGFKAKNLDPQIHIVQTTACHPIAEAVGAPAFAMVGSGHPAPIHHDEEKSLAGAIVDKVGLRKESVAEAVKQTHGGAWIASNDEIKKAIELVRSTAGIEISSNSALSIVGLQQAMAAGFNWVGPVVCLITGD